MAVEFDAVLEGGDAVVTDGSKLFLVVYVVWHPGFGEGHRIAEAVREHFRRRIFENVSGGTGVSVIYRFVEADGAWAPLPINLAEAETTAIVVLMDPSLAGDDAWVAYVHELVERTEESGLGTRVFPVSIEAGAMAALGLAEQALRWDGWTGTTEQRQQQLVGKLTYEFCRMLRHYLEHLRHPTEAEDALGRYLRRVQVFLSHSKHDDRGSQIACAVRDRIHGHHSLSSFFDVHDRSGPQYLDGAISVVLRWVMPPGSALFVGRIRGRTEMMRSAAAADVQTRAAALIAVINSLPSGGEACTALPDGVGCDYCSEGYLDEE